MTNLIFYANILFTAFSEHLNFPAQIIQTFKVNKNLPAIFKFPAQIISPQIFPILSIMYVRAATLQIFIFIYVKLIL